VEIAVKVQYLHSDVHTLERTEILRDLRLGVYDVVVGINLLREGLDLPEVSLVAILDADKEGFLRSETSLIQTIGRAARHLNGMAIMYGDTVTDSMQRAIDETKRRRAKQTAFNEANGIVPRGVSKRIKDLIDGVYDAEQGRREVQAARNDALASTLSWSTPATWSSSRRRACATNWRCCASRSWAGQGTTTWWCSQARGDSGYPCGFVRDEIAQATQYPSKKIGYRL